MTEHQHSQMKRLYLFQQGRCYWCGFQCLSPTYKIPHGARQPPRLWTREHIRPRHTKDTHNLKYNIVGACYACNNLRSHYDNKELRPGTIKPEAIRFARLTGVDPTGGVLTEWLQEWRTTGESRIKLFA
jgi:hypothetical protein